MKAALAGRPYGPFSRESGYLSSLASDCAEWPSTPRPAPLPAAPPQVPVLVISGRDDVRTPLESAQRIAAGYPHATLLEVANVGHSVIRHDYSGCALSGLVAFLTAKPVAQCLKVAPFTPPNRYRPASLPRTPRQTLDAFYYTLDAAGHDRTAFRAWYDTSARELVPGLRGGYMVITAAGLELRAAETIQGVRVSGKLSAKGGTFTVSGPRAAAGTVTIKGSHVTATLGGKRVR